MELVMSSELRVMSWKIDFLSPFPSPLAERGVERSETGRGKRMKEKFPLPFPSPLAERDVERSETGRGKRMKEKVSSPLSPLRKRRGISSAARQEEEKILLGQLFKIALPIAQSRHLFFEQYSFLSSMSACES